MSRASVWIIERRPLATDREWEPASYMGAYAEKAAAKRAFPFNPGAEFRAVRYVRAPQKKAKRR